MIIGTLLVVPVILLVIITIFVRLYQTGMYQCIIEKIKISSPYNNEILVGVKVQLYLSSVLALAGIIYLASLKIPYSFTVIFFLKIKDCTSLTSYIYHFKPFYYDRVFQHISHESVT